ncbi:MAG: glycosyltransferase family 4 protein [Selenomonas sp.]|uniref:glycosyltransferase family 4 protein n=1 Tax=Selenomonas sp. TaxID=2053611 RepID=UPI0025D773F5|nr:glycosyltransferase family 1 protein [Selenomonas sp.]MCR5756873.1 glycosyltransferase family 4 protein [Selenomonas sp.]
MIYSDKLTINLSMFSEKYTGMGIYAMHCRKILKESFWCDEILADGMNLETLESSSGNVIRSPRYITTGYSSTAALYRLFYQKYLATKDLGIVYTPTHHGLIGYKKQIVTIHDLISLRYPKQHFAQYLYFKKILPLIIKDCRGIITVSKTTKLDVCKEYKLSDDFVSVVPNALENNEYIYADKNLDDRGYLLVIGASYPHKNIHELLKMHFLWRNRWNLKIVSSNGSYKTRLKEIINENGLNDSVTIEGYVSNERIDDLYMHCSALVYPSKWEGFGIPPLEAMRYRKPIILSQIDIFKEVFEDSAIYVDIGNKESWKNAFDTLKDDKMIDEYKAKYLKILKKYSWNSNKEILAEYLCGVFPELKELKR